MVDGAFRFGNRPEPSCAVPARWSQALVTRTDSASRFTDPARRCPQQFLDPFDGEGIEGGAVCTLLPSNSHTTAPIDNLVFYQGNVDY